MTTFLSVLSVKTTLWWPCCVFRKWNAPQWIQRELWDWRPYWQDSYLSWEGKGGQTIQQVQALILNTHTHTSLSASGWWWWWAAPTWSPSWWDNAQTEPWFWTKGSVSSRFSWDNGPGTWPNCWTSYPERTSGGYWLDHLTLSGQHLTPSSTVCHLCFSSQTVGRLSSKTQWQIRSLQDKGRLGPCWSSSLCIPSNSMLLVILNHQ